MQIEVNGVTLFYERYGAASGDTGDAEGAVAYEEAGNASAPDCMSDVRSQVSPRSIVLVHGNGEDHHIFDELALELAPQMEVCALDSRGHGQSTPVDTISYDDMAADVIAFIEKLGLDRPALLGFSDGGIIGLLVAIRRPDILSRLAVAGANATPDGVKWNATLYFRLAVLFTRDPAEKARIRMMLDEPQITREQLAGISVPTLVLAGSKDVIREKHTRMIADAIPGSELHILSGEGHSSYVKHSLKVLEYLGPFLSRSR